MEKMATEHPGIILPRSHHPNQGVRRTFLEGFATFLEMATPGDILVTKEADNTSDNAILSRLLDAVYVQGFDVALASCYAPGGGLESTTKFRMILSKCANLIVKLRFNLWGIHTLSSFYRAFRQECLAEALPPRSGHDGCGRIHLRGRRC